jgi:hypothetical protein
MSRSGRPTRLRHRPDHDLLLAAALSADQTALEAWGQWRREVDIEALDQASIEMLPLLASNLKRLGVADPALDRLAGTTRQSWYRNQLLVDAAADATRRLGETGIGTMLVGGAAVTIMAYPDIGLRHLGRVGLAVRGTTATRAAAHLVIAGWTAGSPDGDLVPITDRRGLDLFLTRHVLTDHPTDAADALFWEGCHEQRVAETTVPAPSLTDALLISLLEGLRHGRPTELRWIGDAATAVRDHPNQIEWDRLVDLARRLECGLRVGAGLGYLAETLEVPVPPDVIAALSRGDHTMAERAEHRLWLRGSPGSRPSALVRHWFRYRRARPENGKALGFGGYARKRLRSRSRR